MRHDRAMPAGVVAGFTLVAALVVAWFPFRERQSALAALDHKAEHQAELVAYTIAPAVDFGATDAIDEAFAGVSLDDDFVGIAALGPDGTVITHRGDVMGGEARVTRSVPIVLPSGPAGQVVLTMSTERIDHESSERAREASLIGAVILVLGILVAAGVHRSLVRTAALMAQTEQARRAAEEASAVKSRFLANMSHEMRTPLNGVIGMADVLARRLDGEAATLAHALGRAGRTLLLLVNDLLDLSRIEAGRLEIQKVATDVEAIVLAVAERSLPACRDKRVALTVVVEADVPSTVLSDPLRVEQIVGNLVGNAVKFTLAGTILVRVSVTGTELSIAVEDTGIGIAPDKLETIFEAFTQADGSTTRRFGGSGLGLTISRQLARSLGGEVTVTSRSGEGSRFVACLPIEGATPPPSIPVDGPVLVVPGPGASHLVTLVPGARVLAEDELRRGSASEGGAVLWPAGAAIDEPARATLLAAVGAGRMRLIAQAHDAFDRGPLGALASATLPPLFSRSALADVLVAPVRATHTHRMVSDPPPAARVLLAEDDEINQLVARKYFDELKIRADVVSDGEAAVERATRDGYDVVLMDCQMPRLDGYEAARRIRRFERENGRAPVPIVAVTAHALPEERARALEAGMQGYLTKPLSLDDLRTTLRKFAGGRPAAPRPPITREVPRVIVELRDEPAELATVARLFATNVDEGVVGLAAALEHGDATAVAHLAHKLRGSCLVLGASGAERLAGALERAGREQRLGDAAELVVRLEIELADVRDSLERAAADALLRARAAAPVVSQASRPTLPP